MTDYQEKVNNFFQQKLVWHHVGSLCTDGDPSLFREVRFYNSGEQTGTAHFYPLCSSSTCTGEMHSSRILKNTFELKQVTEHVNFIRARVCLFNMFCKD